MSSPMMLADGAGIASALDTDHVRQLLCQHIPSPFTCRGKDSAKPFHPLPGPLHPQPIPLMTGVLEAPSQPWCPNLKCLRHLSAASVESLWNATVSTKATVSQKQYGG